MTPSEIITQEAQQSGEDADALLRKIHKVVQAKAAVLLQKNNSLMLLMNVAKGVSEVHFFIADDEATLKNSVSHFAKELKNSKLTAIYGDVSKKSNPLLENLFDLLDENGIKIEKSNAPQYVWMAHFKGAQ